MRVTFQEVPAGSPDDGRVIAQSLPADSLAAPGTEITITVARSVQVATTLPPTRHHDRRAHDGPADHRRTDHGAHHPGRPPRFLRPRRLTRTTARPSRRSRRAIEVAERRIVRAVSATSGGAGEEVAHEVMAVRGEDALGMELHALDLVLAVADAHHDAVGRAGGDDECVGDASGGSSVSE